jgi:hypothetical protein
MNRVPFVLLAVALFCGLSLAQDQNQPQTSPTSPNQQLPTATQKTGQQAAEPSSAQPQQPSQPSMPTTGQPSSRAGTAAGAHGGQAESSPRIAPGSVIPVLLTKTIDAKKAKTGDEVVAKVTQDMKTSNGEVLVPKDTKVVGHVTEAQARNKEQKESQVGIAFDRAIMRSGGEMQLPMSIQAIIAPPGANANSEASTPGNDQSPSASRGAGGMSGGRSGTGTAPTGAPGTNPEGSTTPNEGSSGGSAQPQITGSTQGVIGISNVKLEVAQNSAQGSVVRSEKNNVKLESGTLLLLRVNQ